MTHSISGQTIGRTAQTTMGMPVVSCPGNAFVTRVRLMDGRVDETWSTGRMVRNMGFLLRGELDVRGRPRFVTQPHCLCNDGHALAAIKAIEDLAGVTLPRSAVLVRRLVQSMRCIQEHLLHFYQFHIADWVNVNAALRADPAKAAHLDSPKGKKNADFSIVREQIRALAKLSAGKTPEAGYRGPDELHLLLYGHALQAIKAGQSLQAALGILGCGSKGFQAYRLGGLPDDLDLGKEALKGLRASLAACRGFITEVFPSDLTRLARVYGSWAERGRGNAFLTWCDSEIGRLIVSDAKGVSWRFSLSDAAAVREESEPGWSNWDRHRYRLSADREAPSFQWEQKDSYWLPAPRHGDIACEVGPLARVLGGWLSGRSPIMRALSVALDGCALSMEAMNSTLGRVLSRGIESVALMESMSGWVDELESVLARDDRRAATFSMPASGIGVGHVEVPRGVLTHTITWDGGRIVNHDYLIPSLWNFSPRDPFGGAGPLERALTGTPVAAPDHPVEILRTLHQLDPCNVCHVVVEDHDTGRTFLATT
ncbi:MAG: nickel-dependent hydrogenase large subunit [Pseudodesulfovibrio sp.]|nr:nickel-dependent hydrogenase large subunit [Pseudodesulfovibrio sp.]